MILTHKGSLVVSRAGWGLVSLPCPVLSQLFCGCYFSNMAGNAIVLISMVLLSVVVLVSMVLLSAEPNTSPAQSTVPQRTTSPPRATPDSVLESEQLSAFHFCINHMLLLKRRIFISQVTQITPNFTGGSRYLSRPRTTEERPENEAWSS